MTAFVDMKEKIVGEKLDRITSWLANTIDGDTKHIALSLLLSDGVLSEQSKRFLSHDARFNSVDSIDIPTARILIKDTYEKELEYLIKPHSFLCEYLSGTNTLDMRNKLSGLSAYEYYPIILS